MLFFLETNKSIKACSLHPLSLPQIRFLFIRSLIVRRLLLVLGLAEFRQGVMTRVEMVRGLNNLPADANQISVGRMRRMSLQGRTCKAGCCRSGEDKQAKMKGPTYARIQKLTSVIYFILGCRNGYSKESYQPQCQ